MKTRSFLSTSLLLGTIVVSSPAFARVPQSGQPAVAAKVQKDAAQQGYIRELRDKSGSLEAVQTVIRQFTPVRGNRPTIALVAAIHVGEKSYYKQVQQFLDKQDVVLFEGVGRPHSSAKAKLAQTGAERASKMALPSVGNKSLGSAKPPVGIQKKLSNALDLQFQLEGIHYDRPNFRNSDLDWNTLSALATKSGPDTQRLLNNLQTSVSGGPDVTASAQIVDKVLTYSSTSPLLAAMLRRLLMTVLGKAESSDALSALAQTKGGSPSSAKKLETIIVNERNKAVIADLKTLIETSKKRSLHPVRSVAVFYGAGHMKDMEQHLISDLGYRAASSQWLTAIQAAHGPVSRR